MKYLVLDFEAKELSLKERGPGWAYNGCSLIGCAIVGSHTELQWVDLTENLDRGASLLNAFIRDADILIAHNAQYDFGILQYVLNVDIMDKTLVDTMTLAKLYDNTLRSYKLNDLAQKYLNEEKESERLASFVRYAQLYHDSSGKLVKTKDLKRCGKWAKANMDVIYDLNPKLLIEYALKDVSLSEKLYKFYRQHPDWVPDDWVYKLSCVTKFLLKSRHHGVRVDRDKMIEVRDYLKTKEDKALEQVRQFATSEFNPEKSSELHEVVVSLGIPFEIRKTTNNPILDKGWLQSQDHPFCVALREYRRVMKVRRDFCDKILKIGFSDSDGNLILYPTFNIFGAETGRFSSNSPNLQQIPARDKEIGPLLRSCFLPRKGEKWVQMDYGQQEFRLFAHYCYVTKIDPILKLEYDRNPRKDYHDMVTTEVLGLDISERPSAKAVNLGSIYGMGKKKQSLKLKELGMTIIAAEAIYDKYHLTFPAVKKFSRFCADTLKKRGFIKTILGRRSRNERPYKDPESGEIISFEYQGISKVIQGAAADQMIATIVMSHELGLDDYIMFSIHDQLCSSVPENLVSTVPLHLQSCMLSSIKISVPMTADIGIGDNWAESEKVKH